MLDFAPTGGVHTTAAPNAQLSDPLGSTPPLSAENNDDSDAVNPTPGIDAHTITLESGETLAGVLNDAGATPSADASVSAVSALTKVFDPRQIRAGMTFQVTFEALKQAAPVAQITYARQPARRAQRLHRRRRWQRQRRWRAAGGERAGRQASVGELLADHRPGREHHRAMRAAISPLSPTPRSRPSPRISTAPARRSIPASISQRCRRGFRRRSSSR